MELEKNLKQIKDCQLDIELLRRENEKLCSDNNIKINGLETTIGLTEEGLEIGLKESGEKKLECKFGYVSYRTMPDKWEYMDSDIITWCKDKGVPYFKTIEIVEKMKLKKAILSSELKIDEVKGVTVIPQEPKFNYKVR